MTYRIEFEHWSGATQILPRKWFDLFSGREALRVAHWLTVGVDNPAWRGVFHAINEKGERI